MEIEGVYRSSSSSSRRLKSLLFVCVTIDKVKKFALLFLIVTISNLLVRALSKLLIGKKKRERERKTERESVCV